MPPFSSSSLDNDRVEDDGHTEIHTACRPSLTIFAEARDTIPRNLGFSSLLHEAKDQFRSSGVELLGLTELAFHFT